MMLLTTASLAIGQKLSEERKRRKEARQGSLRVGSSEEARRIFEAQHGTEGDGGLSEHGIRRSGTEIKYEDPKSIESPEASVARITTPAPEYTATSSNSKPDFEAARPGTASSLLTSPTDTLMTDLTLTDPSSSSSVRTRGNSNPPPPPPLTPSGAAAPRKPSSDQSHDSDTLTLGSTTTSSTASRTSDGSLRIHTRGSELRSGFPYHPGLFELHVHPTKWEAFTTELIQTTKFGIGDHAQIWAAATGVALTGAFVTSVLVGRGMKQRAQEKKVKAGLADTTLGSLGDILAQWNDEYFRERGLLAHLELSDSAMKHPGQQSKLVRKGLHWYPNREERERKREERKFVIVVSKVESVSGLGEVGEVCELPAEGMVEMDAVDGVAELPGEEGRGLVELPGDFAVPGGVSLGFGNEKAALPSVPGGYAELGSTEVFEKADDRSDEDDEKPLLVTASTHAALNKEVA